MSILCKLGWHSWFTTKAVYRTAKPRPLEVPMSPAKRQCRFCAKRQHQVRDCISLNPVAYKFRWYTV